MVRYPLMLPAALRDRAEAQAGARYTTLAAWIRQAIAEKLARDEPKTVKGGTL